MDLETRDHRRRNRWQRTTAAYTKWPQLVLGRRARGRSIIGLDA